MAMVLVVLLLSITLQLVAAFLAIRLTRVTSWRSPWLLIAGASVLMTVRRMVTLSNYPHWDSRPPQLSAELIALAISALMVFGVALLGRHLRAAKQALLELDAQAAQTRHTQKMEAFGQLAAGVAHDMNNLLTVIFGSLESVQSSSRINAAESSMLDDVHRATTRAKTQMLSLLTFARQVPPARNTFDLHAMLAQNVDLLRRALPPRIQLEISDTDCPPMWVHADEAQLQQVLFNLVFNARDAIQESGSVMVSADLSGFGDDARACVSVRDSGTGIPDADRQRIFEPFYTTKPAGTGTGLGLAVAQSVVEEHGGTITAESELGHGTTISFCLPIVAAPAEESLDTLARRPQGVGPVILLAEDNEQVRELIATSLRAGGYAVLGLADGNDAAQSLRERGNSFALAILDHELPGQSGLEILRELRRRGSKLPVLAISGNLSAHQEDLLALGAKILHKPFTMGLLLLEVGKLLPLKPGMTASG